MDAKRAFTQLSLPVCVRGRTHIERKWVHSFLSGGLGKSPLALVINEILPLPPLRTRRGRVRGGECVECRHATDEFCRAEEKIRGNGVDAPFSDVWPRIAPLTLPRRRTAVEARATSRRLRSGNLTLRSL